MLIKLLSEEHPDLIAVAFDSGAPTVRLAKDAEYKAGRRETPGDFKPQLGLIEEVLDTLHIPVLRVSDGHEADDYLGTLAVRAADEGLEATIVTADRDFFQLVRPGIRVMFNRKGISDIVVFDEAAVEEKYGIPPEKYLDYVALKGDTSDNIPGVPGVGEKTAAKLVQSYGSVEGLIEHVDELKGKLKENVQASVDRLALNKDLARIETDAPVPVDPDDCVMGEWDPDEVRRLFNSLEFRSLFDRLQDVGHGAKPKVEVAELDLREASVEELETLLRWAALRSRFGSTWRDGRCTGWRSPPGAPRRPTPPSRRWRPWRRSWPMRARPSGPTMPRRFERTVLSGRPGWTAVAFDTMLAGYLLDPASAEYPLRTLCERYLGADVLGAVEEEDEGQLFADAPWRAAAAEAAAVALLAPVMDEQIEQQGLRPLLEDVELPLAVVLARMEARGVRLDADYLAEMGAGVRERMAALKATVYAEAGEEFNLNSPAAAPQDPLRQAGAAAGEEDARRASSPRTPASSRSCATDNPIVDALLSWRELDKLNSTYLEALPAAGRPAPTAGSTPRSTRRSRPPAGCRRPTRTCRTSPCARSSDGRSAARSCRATTGQVLLCRLLPDRAADPRAPLGRRRAPRGVRRGSRHPHRDRGEGLRPAARSRSTRTSRGRAKMVNYGLAYGMNAWGLAQRLDIAPDEAQEIMDGYFAASPRSRSTSTPRWADATVEGFTETLLGRRRYIPELQAANPRVRDLGRRQALNAPIQGSASDVFKVAMIAVDTALREHPELDCHMLLTVHDELVFEVPEAQRGGVRGAREGAHGARGAISRSRLRADIGWGANWSDAAPAGH